jgi:eukaryotic-like serine/threonine-protein kinase
MTPTTMPLSSGDRHGSYEIRTIIDAGGMGEVYHARDTQPKREVALKVLSAEVSADQERPVIIGARG